MSGLLLKDLLVLRKGAKAYLIFLALYAVLSLFWSSNLFSTLLVVIVMMLPMNCFSWDNYTKWDTYAMALPIRRRTVVASRYLLVLLIAAAAMVLMAALSLVSFLISGVMDWDQFLLSYTSSMAGALLLNALTLPLLYKYGPERARILMMVCLVVIFAGIYLLEAVTKDGGQPVLPAVNQTVVLAIVLLALLAAFAVSYLISCHIYEHKEA